MFRLARLPQNCHKHVSFWKCEVSILNSLLVPWHCWKNHCLSVGIMGLCEQSSSPDIFYLGKVFLWNFCCSAVRKVDFLFFFFFCLFWEQADVSSNQVTSFFSFWFCFFSPPLFCTRSFWIIQDVLWASRASCPLGLSTAVVSRNVERDLRTEQAHDSIAARIWSGSQQLQCEIFLEQGTWKHLTSHSVALAALQYQKNWAMSFWR